MVAIKELKFLEDEEGILDMLLLKATLDLVFDEGIYAAPAPTTPYSPVDTSPLSQSLSLRLGHSLSMGSEATDDDEDDDAIFSSNPQLACGRPLAVDVDRCLSRSLGGSESGYSSMMNTPQRKTSRNNSESNAGVTDQLFKWSPSLPTTPGSPVKSCSQGTLGVSTPCSSSRRSQSADSPKKPQQQANSGAQVLVLGQTSCIRGCHVKRQLFRTVNVDGKQELRAVATRSPSTEVSQSSGASAASTSSTAVNNSATANSSVINPNKYKTMHCRNFSTKGSCEYGSKCQFAHGSGELRVQSQHPKFKTEMCRNYVEQGFCEWRDGCIFRHGDTDLINPKMLRQSKEASSSQLAEKEKNE